VFSLFGKRKQRPIPSGESQRKLYIPESLYRKMINHCREEKPLEACGLLAGVGGQVLAAYATDNEYRSPVLYKVDDRQLLQAFRQVQSDRQEIIGIYHSHVRTAPVPSLTDIEQATWPEAFYVIVSLAHRIPEVRAYRIVDREVTEHLLVVQRDMTGVWHDLRQMAHPPVEQERGGDITW
jgi:proteasome lid subunit RPN8/RPN11